MQTLDSVFLEDAQALEFKKGQKKTLLAFVLFSLCDTYIGSVLNVKFINGNAVAPNQVYVSLSVLFFLLAGLAFEITGRKKWFIQVSLGIYIIHLVLWLSFIMGFSSRVDSFLWDMVYMGARSGVYISLIAVLLRRPHPSDLYLKVVLLVYCLERFISVVSGYVYIWVGLEETGFAILFLVLAILVVVSLSIGFKGDFFTGSFRQTNWRLPSALLVKTGLLLFTGSLVVMFYGSINKYSYNMNIFAGGSYLIGDGSWRLFYPCINFFPVFVMAVYCLLPFKLRLLPIFIFTAGIILVCLCMILWNKSSRFDSSGVPIIWPIYYLYTIGSLGRFIYICTAIVISRYFGLRSFAGLFALCGAPLMIVTVFNRIYPTFGRFVLSGQVYVAGIVLFVLAVMLFIKVDQRENEQKQAPNEGISS